MNIEDKFREFICEPLEKQEKDIGKENLHLYRICAICLDYTLRSTYSEHMKTHGYETLNIEVNPYAG